MSEVAEVSEVSVQAAYERLRARMKDPIGSVIDIGASNGCWTESIRRFFPESRFHLIEANDVHEPRLKQYVGSFRQMSYVLAAAGPKVGTGNFWIPKDIWGGAVMDVAVENQTRPVVQTTVDHEVERLGLKGPFFLKLDTHGYEREILAGAAKTLKQTRLIQLEVYTIEYRPGIALNQILSYMDGLGFRVSEFSEPKWRPLDNAFFQMDAIFEPVDAPVFRSHAWA